MATKTKDNADGVRELDTPDELESDKMRQSLKGDPPQTGYVAMAAPFEMEKILDFTGLRGSGPNIYYSLIYQLPKWNFTVKKLDEYIEVTPTWAEYYNLTIAQKQKLEASIKQGLTSAAQAVTDFELLKHDLRRYEEVLNYFKKAEKSKDEHVLRSLFVDRVDQHTGEPYSMISMSRRWPTIITDFIRMKSSLSNRDEIKKELDITQAEATVLLTKNQLYLEWKRLFFPEIKDRVARLQVLVESRKKSIDEYRSWLKPYMARYRAIREKTELKPEDNISNPYHTPGFGQSQALTGVRLWFWRQFSPPEKGKPESVMDKPRAGMGFVIDPYDDFVKYWQEKIEKRYQVTISEEEVNKILKNAVNEKPVSMMDPKVLYYALIDAKIVLSMTRTPPPEGAELDNLMFLPLKGHVVSQNILLIHLIEIYAREKSFERQINQLIGTKEAEEEAKEKIEKEFEADPKEKWSPFKRLKRTKEKKPMRDPAKKTPFHRFAWLFIKRGPYEPVFKERLSKMYARGMGGTWVLVLSFIQQKMQVE